MTLSLGVVLSALPVTYTAAAASAVTGKAIKVVPPASKAPATGGAGGPSPTVTSTAVADITGRPATSLRAFFAANKDRLVGDAR